MLSAQVFVHMTFTALPHILNMGQLRWVPLQGMKWWMKSMTVNLLLLQVDNLRLIDDVNLRI